MADAPNLDELMKMAQKMQDSMKTAHQELANLKIMGESGAGLVRVVINGRHDCVQVIISDDAMDEKKDVLEDLIAAAINDANTKVEDASKKKMMSLTQELGIPADQIPKDEDD